MKKIILIILLLASFQAYAAPLVSKQPIEIDADALEVFQKESRAVFSGNVVAKQGEMRLTASKMVVFYKPGGGDDAIERIEVSGNVALNTPAESAKGQSGVYDTINEVVTLSGDVVLTRDNNILKGSKLVYNIATGRSKIVKDEGGRVRGLFVPSN